MIYLRTGKPGASKSLNSLKELVSNYDPDRPFFYHNIRLLMLDMEVCKSFSGFFYGWYWPRLKEKGERRKLEKIIKQVHDNDEFVTLNDVPWLEVHFDSHNHIDTWLYWVRRVYDKKHLDKLNDYLQVLESREDKDSLDMFEIFKRFNLHFTHFSDPRAWFELPKRSIILIDECQQFFPPRGVGSKVPVHIGKFETHRHDGHDVHLITQDPKLMDVNIRRLVGRHVHFHNPFGGKSVTRYQQSKSFDPDQWFDLKAASKKPIRHDKKFYGVYWSSELHTHGFKLPPQFLVLLLLICFLVFLFYYMYNFFNGDKETEVVPAAPSSPSSEPHKDTSTIDSFFDGLTQNIYISGSTIEFKSTQRVFSYSFVNTDSGAVFFPEYVGMQIEPKSHCFAILKFETYTKPVTCDPFYVREVQLESDNSEIKAGETIMGATSGLFGA